VVKVHHVKWKSIPAVKPYLHQSAVAPYTFKYITGRYSGKKQTHRSWGVCSHYGGEETPWNAGLARARAKGTKLGRRTVKPSVEARIRELKGDGMGILKIGRTVGVGTSVVQRVLA
jgi:hypothetical protein